MIGDLAIVERWLAAVNDEDASGVASLTSEQVEIVGPRGQGLMERRVVGDWLARAGGSNTSRFVGFVAATDASS